MQTSGFLSPARITTLNNLSHGIGNLKITSHGKAWQLQKYDGLQLEYFDTSVEDLGNGMAKICLYPKIDLTINDKIVQDSKSYLRKEGIATKEIEPSDMEIEKEKDFIKKMCINVDDDNEDWVKFGNSSIIYVYQDINTLEYNLDWANVSIVLYKNISNDWNNTVNDIWIFNYPNSYKFAANDSNNDNLERYKYKIESSFPIIKNDYSPYIENPRKVRLDKYSYTEIHEFDFTDICNREFECNNETEPICNYTAECKFNYYDDGTSFYLEVTFLSDKFIDPTIKVSEEDMVLNSLLDNVTAETGASNFTHLTILNSSPYDSLVGYWSFDADAVNTEGFTAYDFGNDNNDGTGQGNAVVNDSDCIFGNCLHLDGDDWVDVGNLNDRLEGINKFSVSFWVKCNNSYLDAYEPMMKMTDQVNIFAFTRSASEYLEFHVYNSTGAKKLGRFGYIRDTNWHHVVGVWNGTTVLAYVDGVVGTYQQELLGVTPVSASNLDIGGENGEFPGLIDEVMVFDTALTDSQILDIYNNQSSRFNNKGTMLTALGSITNSTTWNNNGDDRVNLTVYFDELLNTNVKARIGQINISVSPEGLKGFYTFEFENSNKDDKDVVKDLSSAGYDFELYRNVGEMFEFDANVPSRVIRFYGTQDDYITLHPLDVNYQFNSNSTYTFLTWFVANSTSGFELMTLSDFGSNPKNAIILNGSDVLFISNGTSNYSAPWGPIEDSVWSLLVMTYDAGTVQFYKNGTAVGSPGTSYIPDLNEEWILDWAGSFYNFGGGYFNGTLDNIMIFNRVLTAEEIDNLHKNQSITLDVTYYTEYQNITSGTESVFNISSNADFLAVELLLESDSNNFYTPISYDNITITTWSSTAPAPPSDTEYPIFSNYAENPANNTAYSFGQLYEFNVTIINTNGTAGLEFNGVNYTLGNLSSNFFNSTIKDLGAGTYSYYWWAYGNGSSNNYNTSETRSYTIKKANPTGSLLNSAGWTITYATFYNITISESNNGDADVTYDIYRDGVKINEGQYYNLSAGTYNFILNTTGGQNWSANSSMDSQTLTINKASSSVYMFLNNVRNNLTIQNGTIIDINATRVSGEGEIIIYQDGNVFNQGSPPLYNSTNFTTAPSLHNFTAYYPETTNFTSSSETYWLNVTFTVVDTTPPNISFVDPTLSNGSITEQGAIVINVSISEKELGEVKFNWNGTNYTILNDNLVVYFNLDNRSTLGEVADSLVVDLAKGDNNGTVHINGSGTWTTNGKYNGAYNFDGEGDYINLSTSGIDKNQGSIFMWVKPNDVSGSDYLFGHIATDSRIYLVKNNADYGIRLSNMTAIIDTGKDFTNGIWNHIGLVWNSTYYFVYFDGNRVKEGSHSGLPNLDSYVWIGSLKEFTWSYSNATIDEVMIWNTTLGDNEVQQLYFSNLYKYDTDKWALYINQSKNSTSNLELGKYTYFASAKDSAGNENLTETREVNIVQGCQVITEDNAVITLEKNLTILSGICFNVTANNVIIDLNNYRIHGNVSGGYCDWGDVGCEYGDVQKNYAIYTYGYNNLTIRNGKIQNFSFGIYLKNSNNNSLHDIEVKHCSASGIRLENMASSNLTNVVSKINSWHGIQGWNLTHSIIYNFTGFADRETILSLRKDSNYNNLSKLTLYDCALDHDGALSDYPCMRLMDSSYNLIEDVYINDSNGHGIFVFADNSSAYGTGQNSSHNIFRNLVIENTDKNEVWIDNAFGYDKGSNINNTFVNATWSGVETVNVNSELIRKWHYRAYVNDSNGNAISGVNVTAYNVSGNYQFNLTTDGTGYTETADIIDYVNIGGTRNYYSLYDITANNITYKVTHTFNVTSSGNTYEDVFTFDTVLPSITIVYPEAKNYSINVNELNYTITETNPDKCWYSTDGGITNSSTVSSGINFTSVSSSEGSNTWYVYCNDTFGNENSASITFNKDTINPLIEIVYPTNTSNFSTVTVEINYTISDANLDSCWWTNNSGAFNNSITCGNNISETWTEGINTINIYVNDTFGNINSSSVTFLIDISPVCKIENITH